MALVEHIVYAIRVHSHFAGRRARYRQRPGYAAVRAPIPLRHRREVRAEGGCCP